MEMVNDDREGQVPSVEDDLFWHPPADAPKDWKPTFEVRPTQAQPGRSFSIKGLLSRSRGSSVEEETGSMQVESRDQGLVRRSSRPSKQIHRPTALTSTAVSQCESVKEEEEEPPKQDDVVQVEPPTSSTNIKANHLLISECGTAK